MGKSASAQEGVYMFFSDQRNVDFTDEIFESSQDSGGPMVVITTDPFALNENFDALGDLQSNPSRLNSAILRRALWS
jgi:hypothetical protein